MEKEKHITGDDYNKINIITQAQKPENTPSSEPKASIRNERKSNELIENNDDEIDDKLEYENIIIECTETAISNSSSSSSSSSSESESSDEYTDEENCDGLMESSSPEKMSSTSSDQIGQKSSVGSDSEKPAVISEPFKIVKTKISNDFHFVKIIPPTTTTAATMSAISNAQISLPVISNEMTTSVFKKSDSPEKISVTTDVTDSPSVTPVSLNIVKEIKYEIERTSTPSSEKSSTPEPKMSRDLKQLKKTINASKVLTEMMNYSDSTKPRKSRNAKETEFSLSSGDLDLSQNRSRSKSVPHGSLESKSPSDVSDGDNRVRRNMRSQNIEFAQKQQKFLNRIQSQQDSDGGFNSDEESIDSSVGVKPIEMKEKKYKKLQVKDIHPPPKVCRFCLFNY